LILNIVGLPYPNYQLDPGGPVMAEHIEVVAQRITEKTRQNPPIHGYVVYVLRADRNRFFREDGQTPLVCVFTVLDTDTNLRL
jgi:hypothetical protein